VTDHELEDFEVELRKSQPANLPESLVARLRTISPPTNVLSPKVVPPSAPTPSLLHLLRWLIPAAAVILVSAVIWRDKPVVTPQSAITENRPPARASTASPVFKADNVQIGQELVSSFDAVATLPGGEPVRFRCRQWLDQVVVRDDSQGLLVDNRTPRFEVVPMGFVSY
jgi:hypothetical protein